MIKVMDRKIDTIHKRRMKVRLSALAWILVVKR